MRRTPAPGARTLSPRIIWAWCAILAGLAALGTRPYWGSWTVADRQASARPDPRDVLRPMVEGVVALDPEEVGKIVEEMRLSGKPSLPDLVHAFQLFGPEARVGDGTGGDRALDLVLDASRGEAFFGSKPLGTTRYGARFPLHVATQAEINQGGAEAHRGQTLAVLAGLGLSLDYPIRTGRGAAGSTTLRAVLEDLTSNYLPEGEIYWEAVSFGLLLPPQRCWTNKFGKTFGFDDLVAELLRRPVDESACGGVHRLHSLAVILRADMASPVLSTGSRASIREHLTEVAKVLAASQEPAGSWPLDWHLALASKKPAVGPGESDASWARLSRIIATGHHLEWLMLLPDDMRPPPEVFASGARWLLPALRGVLTGRDEAHKVYCPATHAVRAVRILSTAERVAPRVAGRQRERQGGGGPKVVAATREPEGR